MDRSGLTTPEIVERTNRQNRNAFETSGEGHLYEPPVATEREIQFRHGAWRAERAQVRDALATCQINPRRLARWDGCGAAQVVQYSKELDKWRVTAWCCHDRMCRPCQARRVKKLAAIVRHNVGKDPSRFITLTMKHSATPLRDQIKRLRSSFNKLKRTREWRTAVAGGVATLEVKTTAKNEWHPHLHIVVTGTYMPQARLAELWHQITGDSFTVDIRIVHRVESATHYVSKYVTKGCDNNTLNDPSRLIEYVNAMRGQRAFNVFGNWKSVDPWQDEKQATDWKVVTTIDDLVAARDRGEPWAQAILRQLRKEPTTNTNPEAPAEDLDIPPPDELARDTDGTVPDFF